MREVQCSREASRYIDENHNLIPDIWQALFALRDADDPLGMPYDDEVYLLTTEYHEIYYEWVTVERKEVYVIKPLP